MAEQDQISFQRGDDTTLLVRFSGAWRLRGGLPSASLVDRELQSAAQVRGVAFDTKELISWDSSVLAFLVELSELCRQRGINMDRAGLPAGVRRLLHLAEAVPEKKRAQRRGRSIFSPTRGRFGHRRRRLFGRDAQVPRRDERYLCSALPHEGALPACGSFLLIQQCGAQALPIVTLISFLVGVILAFVGAVQLKQFGAQIYVADLVGIAIVREMGAMMTGIIMAGRTGAAFAAQLGTMKVTQEIDAFTTLGLLASGIFSAAARDRFGFDDASAVSLRRFRRCAGRGHGRHRECSISPGPRTFARPSMRLGLTDLFGGVFKSAVYGVLVALSGCLRGIQCGNSSSAVGDAATSAVVTGIVAIVAACGIFAVVFYVLGI